MAKLLSITVRNTRAGRQQCASLKIWENQEYDHVRVKIQHAMLEYIASGQVVLSSRIIVGRPLTPTPVDHRDHGQSALERAGIDCAERNAPTLARRSDVPCDRNMILVSGPNADPHGLTIDWETIERAAFPYQIRQ